MPWPQASPEQVEFFARHGWIRVADAIDPADLQDLIARCEELVAKRESMAFDWAWQKDTPRAGRTFRILQASPTRHWPGFNDAHFRQWAVEFASTLMGAPLEFWYDQFLAKPPHNDAPTYWHQDEAYWGRNLDNRGITCWMPFHAVDVHNGCMHFIDAGHADGVLQHRQPAEVQSDLLQCTPDEARSIACPLNLGDVTFHHSKTPHMTPANNSDTWRRILTQHLRVVGSAGEGDHYPWKVYVNQFTGERTVPRSR